jgi:hypothetical protein
MFQFLIPAAASLLGGALASKGAKKAADTQADAAEKAADAQLTASREANATNERMLDRQLGVQQDQFNRAVQLQMPGLQRGNIANNRLMQLMGLDVPEGYAGGMPPAEGDVMSRLRPQFTRMSPDGAGTWEDTAGLKAAVQREMGAAPGGQMMARPSDFGSLARGFTMQDFQQDPGYDFRMEQGMKSLQRGAAAGGRLGSGRYMKDLLRFGQGLGAQEYGAAYDRFNNDQGTQFNRLSSLGGGAQTAANNVGAAGQNYANQASGALGAYGQNVGQNLMAAGNARASSYTGAGNAAAAGQVGSSNAWNGAIGQGINMWQNNRMMDIMEKREPESWRNTGSGMPNWY